MTHATILQQGTIHCFPAGLRDERLFVAYDNDRHLGLGSVDERDKRHTCEAPYSLLHVS